MNKYENTYCKYCTKEAVFNVAEALECTSCNKYIHISCLKRQSVPGGIVGDTFFKFTCQECSETGNEIFVREKMTWFQIIILIMYHIQNKTAGTGKRGFYHWRIHLVTVIEKKWDDLFSKVVKRRKNWMGTVSGSLSHFSPCFFTSGTPDLGLNGWWKLTFPDITPTTTLSIYNEITSNKQSNLKRINDIIHIQKLILKYVPRLAELDDTFSSQASNESINQFMENINVDIEDELKLSPCKLFDATNSSTTLHHDLKINQVLDDVSPPPTLRNGFKKSKKIPIKYLVSPIKQPKNSFYKFWRKHERKIQQKYVALFTTLRDIEENTLYNYMREHKCKSRSEIALKRKLHVRYLKRKHGLQTLNVDNTEMKYRKYYFTTSTLPSNHVEMNGKAVGRGELRLKTYFTSPYTLRWLKPFIRRDAEPKSTWLDLMTELMAKVNSTRNVRADCEIASLDYVYIQPNHIPVINSLCEKYFWPGIDVSEALECPEFSVVVLYKKLVVAFGFMIPSNNLKETYISFVFTRPEWRRAGIATFMIYHLIQTCMSTDVTLHVAIDNPALFLYQKFGFKVEKVICNFYDTYKNDNECKHAFFLRLER